MNSKNSVFRSFCLIAFVYIANCSPTSTLPPKKLEQVTAESKTEETQVLSATENQPVSSDRPEKQQSDSKAEEGGLGKGHMFEYAYSMSHDSMPFTASAEKGAVLPEGSTASEGSRDGAQAAAPRNPVEFMYHQQYHPQHSAASDIPTEYYGPKSSEQLEDFFKQMFSSNGEARGYQPSEQKEEKPSNGGYSQEMTQSSQDYPQTYPFAHNQPHGPHGPPRGPQGPPHGGFSGYNPPNYDHYGHHPPPQQPHYMNNVAHNDGPHGFGGGHDYPSGDNKAKLVKMNVGKQNNDGKPWGSKTTYVYRDPKKPGNFMEITEMNVAVNKDGTPDMADPSSRNVGGMFNHYEPYGPSGAGHSGPHSPGSYSYYEGPYGGAEPHEPPEPFF